MYYEYEYTVTNFTEEWIEEFEEAIYHEYSLDKCDLEDFDIDKDCVFLKFKQTYYNDFKKENGSPTLAKYPKFKVIIDNIVKNSLSSHEIGSAIYSNVVYINKMNCSKYTLDCKWFIWALKKLEKTIHTEKAKFKGVLEEFTLITDLGIEREKGEVKQILTIHKSGDVKFLSYKYNEFKKCRSRKITVSSEIAKATLELIEIYLKENHLRILSDCTGKWDIVAKNTIGKIYNFSNALDCNYKVMVNNIDLSDLIRKTLNLNDLFLFDGNGKYDRINSILIEYNYYTGNEFQTYEKLLLNRDTKTITIQSNSEDDYDVCFQCKSENIIYYCFDKISKIQLKRRKRKHISCNENSKYLMIIDYKYSNQLIYEGVYCKNDLPINFSKLIEIIKKYLKVYNDFAILDPHDYNSIDNFYNDEYTYCKVRLNNKEYYYISLNNEINIGDEVVVPVGDYGKTCDATVTEVQVYKKDDVPFPIEKTKYIIE